ncbi:MAG: hypothetical protein IMF11_09095, partial [Proteobacteria bacterium]|nr:hypothetical protein [Pseudomonadota bacterium]
EIENAGQSGWTESPSVREKMEIPDAILEHNLFGIDIDARSIQLASLVLVMKARESGYEGPINHLNLVVANSAPFESEAWYQFIQNIEKEGKHSVARVLASLGLQLKNLDEFGSLLRIEDEMQKIIQEEKSKWAEQAKAGLEQEYLFPEMAKPKQEKLPFETAITDETFFDRLGSVIHKKLDSFYLKARQDGLAEEAIMVEDAERGFDFSRLNMQRYDVVYTNPPFLGNRNMGKMLQEFLTKEYPEAKADLFASFIRRCQELSKENCYVAMVTMQGWMFLKAYKNLRAAEDTAKHAYSGLLHTASFETICHLGSRAFDPDHKLHDGVAVVLITFRKTPVISNHRLSAIRAVAPSSPEEKNTLIIKALQGYEKPKLYIANQSDFLNIYGYPFVYWLSDKLLKALQSKAKVQDNITITEGAGSRDEERFVKFFWEVPQRGSTDWVPYAKGGGYKKWCGLTYFVLDWTGNGDKIKSFLISRFPYLKGNTKILIRDEYLFFQRGLTYTDFANGCLSCRVVEGFICSDQGPGVFSSKFTPELISSVFNSKLYSYLIRAVSPNPIHIRKG